MEDQHKEKTKEEGEKQRRGQNGHVLIPCMGTRGRRRLGQCKDWEVEGVRNVKLLDMPNRQVYHIMTFYCTPWVITVSPSLCGCSMINHVGKPGQNVLDREVT